MINVEKVKENLSNLRGKSIKIKYSLGRNKYESYDVVIKELYDYVFTVLISDLEFVKSFSYADVISKLIKIDINWKEKKMLITNVEIYKLRKEGSKLKGLATVYLDNEFVIKNIRVIEGEKGLFIAMPSRETKDGKRVDICNPLNQETRNKFEKAIFSKYYEN